MNLYDPVYLQRLNSLTKYPSIPTYHCLGKNKTLLPEVQIPFSGRVIGTEKVDGANFRLIYPGASWLPHGNAPLFLGSRADLLWNFGDYPINNLFNSIPFFRTLIVNSGYLRESGLMVFYGEFYGGGIGTAEKNYTSQGTQGFRLFDVLKMDAGLFTSVMEMPVEKISSWREHGGQPFEHFDKLKDYAKLLGCETTPTLFDEELELPTDLLQAADFTKSFCVSRVALDDNAKLESEGVVVRTADRQFIAKMRNEDYEKTRKMMAKIVR